MIDVAALLSSTTAAIGVAKAVSEAKGMYDQADLKLTIAEIVSTLADVRIALAEAGSDPKAKDEEIARSSLETIRSPQRAVPGRAHFSKAVASRRKRTLAAGI